MFIVRGLYDIARERKTDYFINLKEWKDVDGGWMYLVGFSNDKNIDPAKYFGLPDPLPKLGKHQFLSVKDLDLIFQDR